MLWNIYQDVVALHDDWKCLHHQIFVEVIDTCPAVKFVAVPRTDQRGADQIALSERATGVRTDAAYAEDLALDVTHREGRRPGIYFCDSTGREGGGLSNSEPRHIVSREAIKPAEISCGGTSRTASANM
jgi:hypothetical protein